MSWTGNRDKLQRSRDNGAVAFCAGVVKSLERADKTANTSFCLVAVHTLAKNTSRRRTRSVRDVIKVGLTMITNALVFEQIACESNEEQIANLEGTYSDIQICFQKVQ